MPYPLHKVPPGFLGLLNAKVSGQAPQAYAEQVVPTVETRDFYGLPNLTIIGNDIGAHVGSYSENFLVPTGEVWRVRGGSVAVNIGAGNTPVSPLSMYVQLRAPNVMAAVIAAVIVDLPGFGTLPLSEDFRRIAFGQTDVLLPAGWAVSVSANLTQTGIETYGVSSRVLVERYPV